jgi:hypothetical protein
MINKTNQIFCEILLLINDYLNEEELNSQESHLIWNRMRFFL